jgi:predicted dehydrogenase
VGKRIGVALVGAGVMGSNHARIVSNHPRTDLKLVLDINIDSAQKLAGDHGAQATNSTNDLEGIDAVIVASPTEHHFDTTKFCISRGIPVLVEKPLTEKFEETEELVNLSSASKSVLMCGLLERFNPAVLTAEHIDINPEHFIAIRHSPFTPRIRSNVSLDLMIHDIDLALRFVKLTPSRVRSVEINTRSKGGVPDISEAILEFGGHAVAHLSASRSSQQKIRKILVSDSTRLVEIDLLRRNLTITKNVSEASLNFGKSYRQGSEIEIPELVTSVEPLAAQFEHFLRLIKGEENRTAERNSLVEPHRILSQVIRSNKFSGSELG